MRFFGRKANKQSAKPDVPPELQAYYEQSKGSRLRRASLFVLPVLAVALVLAALIGGAAWLQHHKLSDLTNRFSSSHSVPPKTQSKQSGQQGASTPTQPSPATQLPGDEANQNSTSSPAGSQSTANNSSSGANSTTQPASTNPPATTVPDTGPNDSVLIVSGVMAIAGAAAFHARQVRRSNAAE